MFLSSSGLGLGFDNPLSSQIEEKPLLYSVRNLGCVITLSLKMLEVVLDDPSGKKINE